MVLKDKCKKCNYICNAIYFQQNFVNWTSNNDDIDKFIQYTQLSAHSNYNLFEQALEWIPYDRFYNIKCIAEKKIYRATWIDGSISHWDGKNQNWTRNQNMAVILKRLSDPKNITLEFTNKV
jgi:hypothetical protein